MEWEYLFLYLWPYRERPRDFFFNHCVQWAASQRTLVRVAPMAWMLR